MDPNSIVNRQPAISPHLAGYSPQLYRSGAQPPLPWYSKTGTPGEADGEKIQTTLPLELSFEGSMVVYYPQPAGAGAFGELYVFVPQPTVFTESWNPWKRVDLAWPKIDPRTGKPFDQFLEWRSPLAE